MTAARVDDEPGFCAWCEDCGRQVEHASVRKGWLFYRDGRAKLTRGVCPRCTRERSLLATLRDLLLCIERNTPK